MKTKKDCIINFGLPHPGNGEEKHNIRTLVDSDIPKTYIRVVFTYANET